MNIINKHMKKLFLFFCCIFFIASSYAQGGFAYGVKGGLTLGIQKWNGFDRSVLPKYNGSIFLESIPAEKRFSIFGQLGYHIKGSRVKSFFRNPTTQDITRRNIDTEFRNVSLILGGKSAYPISVNNAKAYYLFGIRGDYNINYSGDAFLPFNDEDVNKFTYGFTFGGGIEIPLSRLSGLLFEVQISPDARPQVFYPANKYSYTTSQGVDVFVGETKVFNTAFEITIGFKFLRVVEYEEE